MAFVFSSRRRHTRWPRDWSSDVCSSDLGVQVEITPRGARTLLGTPAGALGPAVVDLEELLGRSAAVLPQRLHERSGWLRRFALLEEVLLHRLAHDDAPASVPAELDAAWDLLMRSAGKIGR